MRAENKLETPSSRPPSSASSSRAGRGIVASPERFSSDTWPWGLSREGSLPRQGCSAGLCGTGSARQERAARHGSHRAAAPFRARPPAPPGASPHTTGELLLQRLERLLPSSFTDLGVCRAASLTFSLLSHTAVAQRFLPVPRYIATEVPPASLTGLALASGKSLLETDRTSSYLTWGSSWAFLTETARNCPCCSPTTKTLPHKPKTHTNVAIMCEDLAASAREPLAG